MTPATANYEVGDETGASSFCRVAEVTTANDAESLPLVDGPTSGTPSGPFRPLRLGRVPRLLLAAVLTSPIMFFNPDEENRRSGVYSALLRREVRTWRRITLREARMLALQILAETEAGIRRDRIAEARLLASIRDQEQA